MSAFRVANAPCSWGTLEFTAAAPQTIGAARMLDELRETGYRGTELGDWGYMPTEPAALRAELTGRDLTMVGAFVSIPFHDAARHAAGEEYALRFARLLAAVADAGDGTRPLVILSEANGEEGARTRHAGRITPDLALPEEGWPILAAGVERVARAVRAQTGLAVAFHPHCAGYVETPAEIARLLDLTDPDLVGLVFDTGHYLYGSGGSSADAVQEGLERCWPRVRHVHFKDCHPALAARARREGWDYHTAVRNGIFCELGQGAVDFPRARDWLRRQGYDGWIVVEQDVVAGMGTPRESARRNREYLASIGI